MKAFTRRGDLIEIDEGGGYLRFKRFPDGKPVVHASWMWATTPTYPTWPAPTRWCAQMWRGGPTLALPPGAAPGPIGRIILRLALGAHFFEAA